MAWANGGSSGVQDAVDDKVPVTGARGGLPRLAPLPPGLRAGPAQPRIPAPAPAVEVCIKATSAIAAEDVHAAVQRCAARSGGPAAARGRRTLPCRLQLLV